MESNSGVTINKDAGEITYTSENGSSITVAPAGMPQFIQKVFNEFKIDVLSKMNSGEQSQDILFDLKKNVENYIALARKVSSAGAEDTNDAEKKASELQLALQLELGNEQLRKELNSFHYQVKQILDGYDKLSDKPNISKEQRDYYLKSFDYVNALMADLMVYQNDIEKDVSIYEEVKSAAKSAFDLAMAFIEETPETPETIIRNNTLFLNKQLETYLKYKPLVEAGLQDDELSIGLEVIGLGVGIVAGAAVAIVTAKLGLGVVGAYVFGTIANMLVDTGFEFVKETSGDLYRSWIGNNRYPGDIVIFGERNQPNNLFGTPENDVLIGHDKDDILFSQGGRNTLKGGLGYDTYLIGEGYDKILDTDGSGKIVIYKTKETLTGGKRIFNRGMDQGDLYTYTSSDGKYYYVFRPKFPLNPFFGTLRIVDAKVGTEIALVANFDKNKNTFSYII